MNGPAGPPGMVCMPSTVGWLLVAILFLVWLAVMWLSTRLRRPR
jgi:hypothetical protein